MIVSSTETHTNCELHLHHKCAEYVASRLLLRRTLYRLAVLMLRGPCSRFLVRVAHLWLRERVLENPAAHFHGNQGAPASSSRLAYGLISLIEIFFVAARHSGAGLAREALICGSKWRPSHLRPGPWRPGTLLPSSGR